MILEATLLKLVSTLALVTSGICEERLRNGRLASSTLWSLSPSDEPLLNSGVPSSSGGIASVLPGTQRMPQTFSGFLAGGRTSNGFDLETFTKNAAVETNKQQALASQFSLAAMMDQKHTPGSGRLLSEGTFPRPFLLQNGGFNGIIPGLSLSLPSASFQKTLAETMPSAVLQRSSRPIMPNSAFFDGARNGIGFGGENFEGIPFGEARFMEGNTLTNLRGNLMAHARSGAINDAQTASFMAHTMPFLRTLPPDFSSNSLDSIQRSSFGLAETPGDPFMGRGSQMTHPIGSVLISQRPLTDADKIGRGVNSAWFPEISSFSRIGEFTSNTRMQKDDLLDEFRNDENHSKKDIGIST